MGALCVTSSITMSSNRFAPFAFTMTPFEARIVLQASDTTVPPDDSER